MPATPADIAAGSREATIVTWSDPAIAARYPTSRDGTVTPATGFCDTAADAQVLVNARGALIGVERRRFAVTIMDLVWPVISTRLPQARLIDAEQGVDRIHLAARIELDLDAATTNHELFG